MHDLDVSRWLSDHAAESSVNQRAPAAGGSGGDAHRKSSTRRGGGGSPDGGGYNGGGGGHGNGYGYGYGGGGSTATAAAAAASESAAATFSPPLPAPVLYDLVGLVQHTGGLEHGHYTSYTRDDGSGRHPVFIRAPPARRRVGVVAMRERFGFRGFCRGGEEGGEEGGWLSR